MVAGRSLARHGLDRRARPHLRRRASGGLVRVLAGRNRAVSTLRTSARGDVAAVQDDRTVSVISPRRGRGAPARGRPARGRRSRTRPGRRTATSSRSRRSTAASAVLDVRARPERVRPHRARARRLRAWTGRRDGRTLAIGLSDGSVELRDAERGSLLARYHDHEDAGLRGGVRSPTGARYASAARDGLVGLRSGERLPLARGPRGHGRVARVVARREPARLGLARRHDPALGCGRPRAGGVLRGHRLTVWGLAVTPDGARLLSSSFDHDVRVWRGGQLRARARGPRAAGGRARRARRAHGDLGLARRDLPDLGSRHGRLARAPPARAPAREGGRDERQQPRHARRVCGARADAGGRAVARARCRPLERRRLDRAQARRRCGPRCCARAASEAALRRYQERRLRRLLARAVRRGAALPREVRRARGVHPRDFRCARRPAPLPDRREGRDARRLPGAASLRARHRPLALPHPADLGLVGPLHGDRALAALRRRAQRLQPAHLRLARLPLVAHAPRTCSPTALPFENNLGLYRNVWLDAQQPADA